MKKLILLFLIFILTIQITLAVCCLDEGEKKGGCYPYRNTCCEESDKIVGYIGCEYAIVNENDEFDDYDYKCPEETIGTCLECSDDCQPDGTNCNWIDNNLCGEETCAVEYVFYEEKNIPFSSECSNLCGDGEVMIGGECITPDPGDTYDCTDDMCQPGKYCCEEGTKKRGEGEGVCSADNDGDEFCNDYDNCKEISNPDQLDTDDDTIGDACEFEGLCESAYGDRQCCDLLDYAKASTDQTSTFYGFTDDCPDLGGSIGCWSACVGEYCEGENCYEITYEIGPCIDGQRTIKILAGTTILETVTDPCSDIPLIPFFTNLNLIFSLLILFLFYFFKER